MNVPPGADRSKRAKWLSAISRTVGILVGLAVGPFVFFFLYILAIPVGLLAGGLLGNSWGKRKPITTTGFGALGVVLAELIFVLGERFLELPTRAITWFVAPAVGALALVLLPYLAEILWPDQRKREDAALCAVACFMVAPTFIWYLLPADPGVARAAADAVQSAFYTKCDELAQSEAHPPRRGAPPRPSEHLNTLRSFYELCCPGIPTLMRTQEASFGDWRIARHFQTKVTFGATVAYYRALMPEVPPREKPIAAPYPCTRIDGTLHSVPVTVIVGDIPKRDVGVVIY